MIVGIDFANVTDPMAAVRVTLRLDPDRVVVMGRHEKAVKLLRESGYSVEVLAPDAIFPDGVTVIQ